MGSSRKSWLLKHPLPTTWRRCLGGMTSDTGRRRRSAAPPPPSADRCGRVYIVSPDRIGSDRLGKTTSQAEPARSQIPVPVHKLQEHCCIERARKICSAAHMLTVLGTHALYTRTGLPARIHPRRRRRGPGVPLRAAARNVLDPRRRRHRFFGSAFTYRIAQRRRSSRGRLAGKI